MTEHCGETTFLYFLLKTRVALVCAELVFKMLGCCYVVYEVFWVVCKNVVN